MGWATVFLFIAALTGGARDVPPGLGDVARIPSDPVPERLTNDTHYLVSNERRLDLFVDDIDGQPDVYIGVGSAQNYILAGWASPSFMVLVDFDTDIVDLHAIHSLFLAHAQSGAEFERLWSEDAAPIVARLLRVAVPEPTRRLRLSTLYDRARPRVSASLAKTRARFAELDVSCYLDDLTQYDRVATLARTGRIVIKRGDFTQPGVVAELGATLRKAGARVGVLYLSNIEQYFMYRPNYRTNIRQLPLDADTVVLRTLPARPAGFEYLVQRGDHLHAWLKLEQTRSVYRIRRMTPGMERPASQRVRLSAPATTAPPI